MVGKRTAFTASDEGKMLDLTAQGISLTNIANYLVGRMTVARHEEVTLCTLLIASMNGIYSPSSIVSVYTFACFKYLWI